MSIDERLDAMASMIEALGQPALERFVLEHGRRYEPASLPFDVILGPPRECFANALSMAASGGLTYVEGYALMPRVPVLIHHAWVTDAQGRAIDPTWDDNGACEYRGIEFDFEWVLSLGKTGLALEQFARNRMASAEED